MESEPKHLLIKDSDFCYGLDCWGCCRTWIHSFLGTCLPVFCIVLESVVECISLTVEENGASSLCEERRLYNGLFISGKL
ncbi:hypothetical protein Y032_0042g631 [Ancylostoma ceylanicum]|uniref:Uncharacterized protein n=1 Tax=Ancylostoma ceylanicum TaxID=53326 RepID=A0A016UFN4_9BILA|nr:hypothetical protein Y032_0042g631 [Ancylostoma ceylanicum]